MMAFMKNKIDLRGILTLMVLTLPSIDANIDCNGRPFHCVNSTHFMICVDLGSGVSSTIDNYLIPCPPTTVCQGTNRFECEFPVVTTVAPSVAPLVISATKQTKESVTLYEVTTSIPLEEYFNTLSTTSLSEDILITHQTIATEPTFSVSTTVTDVAQNTEVILSGSESNSTLKESIPSADVVQNGISTFTPTPFTHPNNTEPVTETTEDVNVTETISSITIPGVEMAQNDLTTVPLLQNTSERTTDLVVNAADNLNTNNIQTETKSNLTENIFNVKNNAPNASTQFSMLESSTLSMVIETTTKSILTNGKVNTISESTLTDTTSNGILIQNDFPTRTLLLDSRNTKTTDQNPAVTDINVIKPQVNIRQTLTISIPSATDVPTPYSTSDSSILLAEVADTITKSMLTTDESVIILGSNTNSILSKVTPKEEVMQNDLTTLTPSLNYTNTSVLDQVSKVNANVKIITPESITNSNLTDTIPSITDNELNVSTRLTVQENSNLTIINETTTESMLTNGSVTTLSESTGTVNTFSGNFIQNDPTAFTQLPNYINDNFTDPNPVAIDILSVIKTESHVQTTSTESIPSITDEPTPFSTIHKDALIFDIGDTTTKPTFTENIPNEKVVQNDTTTESIITKGTETTFNLSESTSTESILNATDVGQFESIPYSSTNSSIVLIDTDTTTMPTLSENVTILRPETNSALTGSSKFIKLLNNTDVGVTDLISQVTENVLSESKINTSWMGIVSETDKAQNVLNPLSTPAISALPIINQITTETVLTEITFSELVLNDTTPNGNFVQNDTVTITLLPDNRPVNGTHQHPDATENLNTTILEPKVNIFSTKSVQNETDVVKNKLTEITTSDSPGLLIHVTDTTTQSILPEIINMTTIPVSGISSTLSETVQQTESDQTFIESATDVTPNEPTPFPTSNIVDKSHTTPLSYDKNESVKDLIPNATENVNVILKSEPTASLDVIQNYVTTRLSNNKGPHASDLNGTINLNVVSDMNTTLNHTTLILTEIVQDYLLVDSLISSTSVPINVTDTTAESLLREDTVTVPNISINSVHNSLTTLHMPPSDTTLPDKTVDIATEPTLTNVLEKINVMVEEPNSTILQSTPSVPVTDVKQDDLSTLANDSKIDVPYITILEPIVSEVTVNTNLATTEYYVNNSNIMLPVTFPTESANIVKDYITKPSSTSPNNSDAIKPMVLGLTKNTNVVVTESYPNIDSGGILTRKSENIQNVITPFYTESITTVPLTTGDNTVSNVFVHEINKDNTTAYIRNAIKENSANSDSTTPSVEITSKSYQSSSIIPIVTDSSNVVVETTPNSEITVSHKEADLIIYGEAKLGSEHISNDRFFLTNQSDGKPLSGEVLSTVVDNKALKTTLDIAMNKYVSTGSLVSATAKEVTFETNTEPLITTTLPEIGPTTDFTKKLENSFKTNVFQAVANPHEMRPALEDAIVQQSLEPPFNLSTLPTIHITKKYHSEVIATETADHKINSSKNIASLFQISVPESTVSPDFFPSQLDVNNKRVSEPTLTTTTSTTTLDLTQKATNSLLAKNVQSKVSPVPQSIPAKISNGRTVDNPGINIHSSKTARAAQREASNSINPELITRSVDELLIQKTTTEMPLITGSETQRDITNTNILADNKRATNVTESSLINEAATTMTIADVSVIVGITDSARINTEVTIENNPLINLLMNSPAIQISERKSTVPTEWISIEPRQENIENSSSSKILFRNLSIHEDKNATFVSSAQQEEVPPENIAHQLKKTSQNRQASYNYSENTSNTQKITVLEQAAALSTDNLKKKSTQVDKPSQSTIVVNTQTSEISTELHKEIESIIPVTSVQDDTTSKQNRNIDILTIVSTTEPWSGTVVTQPYAQTTSQLITEQLMTETTSKEPRGTIPIIGDIKTQTTSKPYVGDVSKPETQFINVLQHVLSPRTVQTQDPVIFVKSTSGPTTEIWVDVPQNRKITVQTPMPPNLYKTSSNPQVETKIYVNNNFDGENQKVASTPETEFIDIPRAVITESTTDLFTLNSNHDADIMFDVVETNVPKSKENILPSGTHSGISVLQNQPSRTKTKQIEKLERSESVKTRAEEKDTPDGKKEVEYPEPEGAPKIITKAIDTIVAKSKDSKSGASPTNEKNVEEVVTGTPQTLNSRLPIIIKEMRSTSTIEMTTKKVETSDHSINNIEVLPTTTKSKSKKEKSVKIESTFTTDTGSTSRYSPKIYSPITKTHNSSVKFKSSANRFVCNQNSRGRFSDSNNCRKFYICFGKPEPIEGLCPNDTVFSELRKQCTNNFSHCVRNNQFQCISEGRFSDYLNDNIYYICVKNHVGTFIRFKLQCQSGYHLNKTSVHCTLNKEASQSTSQQSRSDVSKNNSDQSASTKSEKLVVESSTEFECNKKGRFPDVNDCRKYYICTKRRKSQFRLRIKRCDSDELFHKDKKKCVDADSYECI